MVEQTVEAQPEEIGILDLIPFKKGMELPPIEVPHYLITKDGTFLRKPTLLGTVTLKETSLPVDRLQSIGEFKGGVFSFSAPPIPKHLVAKTYDFFWQVWDKDKTEAEVLLLFKPDKRTWRIFVPYQTATSASVRSIYDPADIPTTNGWIIVGSIHSHCDFGAFHSGTDKGDASTFNGLHITIGKVDTTKPEFAIMMTVNGVEFDYSKSPEAVADLSDLETAKAPKKWYDKYMLTLDQIKKLPWKTLTKDEVENWTLNLDLKHTRSKAVVVSKYSPPNNNKYTPSYNTKDRKDYWDDDGWTDRWAGYSYGNGFSDTRWSSQIKKSVPKEHLDYTGDIKDEFIIDYLEDEIGRIFELAREYKLFISYDILTAEELEASDLLGKEGSIDDDIKDDIKVLSRLQGD